MSKFFALVTGFAVAISNASALDVKKLPDGALGIPTNFAPPNDGTPALPRIPPIFQSNYWAVTEADGVEYSGSGRVFMDSYALMSRDEFGININGKEYPKVQLENWLTGETHVIEKGDNSEAVCHTGTVGFDVLGNSKWYGYFWALNHVCDTYLAFENGGADAPDGKSYIYYQDAFNGLPRAMMEFHETYTTTIIFTDEIDGALDSAMFKVPSALECPADTTEAASSFFSHRIFH
eukprot:Rmarinus@m.18099